MRSDLTSGRRVLSKGGLDDRLAGGRSYPMTATLWLPPLVKALATALLVVSASATAEALGPFWGALIASLPVSAGPAYVFLAMQHGTDFVAASALSSFAANAATGLFLISYGALAGTVSPWRSLGIAVLAWLVASLATQQVAWTPLTALLLNLAVYGVGFALLNPARRAALGLAPSTRRRWFDLPLNHPSPTYTGLARPTDLVNAPNLSHPVCVGGCPWWMLSTRSRSGLHLGRSRWPSSRAKASSFT